ncbi:MAG: hypothetical protein U0167_19515 [bacterium]
MIPIRTDISPSLHPEALAGDAPVLERDDRPLGKQAIAAAREALTTAYETIGALNDATRALEATSTRRERRNGRVLPVRERNDAFVKSADAALARATSAIDRRSAELARVRDALAARVNEALSLPEHKTPVGIAQGAEVRGYVKALKASERVRFVDAAIESKDRATVAAVIHGGPAYLSGLTAEQLEVLRERAASAWAPDEYQQLRSVEKVIERVAFGGSTLVARYTEVMASLRDSAAARASTTAKALAEGKGAAA